MDHFKKFWDSIVLVVFEIRKTSGLLNRDFGLLTRNAWDPALPSLMMIIKKASTNHSSHHEWHEYDESLHINGVMPWTRKRPLFCKYNCIYHNWQLFIENCNITHIPLSSLMLSLKFLRVLIAQNDILRSISDRFYVISNSGKPLPLSLLYYLIFIFYPSL